MLPAFQKIARSIKRPIAIGTAAAFAVLLFVGTVVYLFLFPSAARPGLPVAMVDSSRLLINQQPMQPDASAIGSCTGLDKYSLYKSKVYFQFINHSCHPVEGDVDVDSFEDLGFGFARDKNHAFYGGQEIEIRNAYDAKNPIRTDGPTFEALGDGYARDKNYVYFLGGPFREFVVHEADPATFEVLSKNFGRDAKQGYYQSYAVHDSDGKTFRGLETIVKNEHYTATYSEDAQHVFMNEKMIVEADPATFEVLKTVVDSRSNDIFSRDARHVFKNTEVIPLADPNSFGLITSDSESWQCRRYFKDATHVFSDQAPHFSLVNGADPATFRIIGYFGEMGSMYHDSCVTADASSVFVDEAKVPFLDPRSTEIVGFYVKDKKGVYIGTNEFSADAATFELIEGDSILGTVLVKDKDFIYECREKVMPNQGAFQALGNYYGKIGSTIYYKGQKINVDGNSFTVLGGILGLTCEARDGGYAKDLRHVYFDGKIVEGANPKTFALSAGESGIAWDKHIEFRDGVKIPNDFVRCSTSTMDLPGGAVSWKGRLPESISIASTSTSFFELCVTPKQEVLIGYRFDESSPAKKFDWFDATGRLTRTLTLDCGANGVTFLGPTIRALNGSILTLTCFEGDACLNRVSYNLDTTAWKGSEQPEMKAVNEEIDCGYRG